jgi:hypothetical protein
MHYKIILKKTQFVLSSNEYETLNLDWLYTDYREALDKYVDLAGDEARHIAMIEYTRISCEIILVKVEENATKKLHFITIAN